MSDKIHPYYPSGSIQPNDFREQIKILKNNFNIISLSEAIERTKSKNQIKNSLVLTIDDGFAECYSFYETTPSKLSPVVMEFFERVIGD